MSRLNPRIPNPATRWFRWSAEDGELAYYDKQQEDEISVPIPFTFLLLDELAKVDGYSESKKASIYSNEVHNISREALNVQIDGKTIANGLYSNIKPEVKQQGGHYKASLYIAYKKDGVLVIGNLGLKGSALKSWMEFRQQEEPFIYEQAIKITGYEEDTYQPEGEDPVTYRYPTFALQDVSEETHEEALDLNRELEKYFESKPDYSQQVEPETPTNGSPENKPVDSTVELDENFDDIDDDLPF